MYSVCCVVLCFVAGLKAKHIIAVELERANIIRRYTENLQREKQHEEVHLKQQLSEVADHSQLFIKPNQDQMMSIQTQYAIHQIAALRRLLSNGVCVIVMRVAVVLRCCVCVV